MSQLDLHRWQGIVVFPPEQQRGANTKTNCYGTREKLRETLLLRTHSRIRDGDELRSQSTNCISMQVLNANNAKPLRTLAVRMFSFVKAGNYPMLFEGKTDNAGSIRFCLGDSIPAQLIYSFGKHFYTCSASKVETAVLLEHGLVDRRDQCESGKLKYKAQPKPGELVVFAQPWSLEEKIFGQFP